MITVDSGPVQSRVIELRPSLSDSHYTNGGRLFSFQPRFGYTDMYGGKKWLQQKYLNLNENTSLFYIKIACLFF